MISRYNRVSLAVGAPGLVLQTVGLVGHGWWLAMGGSLLLLVGLAFYARSKGRSAWWGLFGLLGWIGLVVLALLRDEAPHFTNPDARKHIPASANWAFWLALIAIVPVFGLPLGLTAFVLGLVGLSRVKNNPLFCGTGRAWTGVILGGSLAFLHIAIPALVVILTTLSR
jgi:hypothetical protein